MQADAIVAMYVLKRLISIAYLKAFHFRQQEIEASKPMGQYQQYMY